MGDGSVLHLKGLPLQHLDLTHCREITDGSLMHLKGLPFQVLNLSYCYNITDGGVLHLKGLPLRYLNLYNCSNVTDSPIYVYGAKDDGSDDDDDTVSNDGDGAYLKDDRVYQLSELALLEQPGGPRFL